MHDVAVGVRYAILLDESDLREGLNRATAIASEIWEVAEAVTAGVEDIVAAAAKRLRG